MLRLQEEGDEQHRHPEEGKEPPHLYECVRDDAPGPALRHAIIVPRHVTADDDLLRAIAHSWLGARGVTQARLQLDSHVGVGLRVVVEASEPPVIDDLRDRVQRCLRALDVPVPWNELGDFHLCGPDVASSAHKGVR